MRYENELCPVCEKLFTLEEITVVCPVCGTPHHKSCYDNVGECFNTSQHESGYTWVAKSKGKIPESNEKETENDGLVICEQCGFKNTQASVFCKNCRAPLISTINEQINREFSPIVIDGEIIPDNMPFQDSVSVGEAGIYIQNNKNSYLKTFINSGRANKKPKFNWAAFIFCPYWFFYRKMYRPGFAFMGIFIALSLIFDNYIKAYYDKTTVFIEKVSSFIESTNGMTAEMTAEMDKMVNELISSFKPVLIFFALSLIISIVAGFIANKIYKARIYQDIMSIRKFSNNDQIYTSYLFAKGGTSLFSAVGAILIYRLLVSFIIQSIQSF